MLPRSASSSTVTAEMALEGKNYRKFYYKGGQLVRGEVPLSNQIRAQVYKDFLWIREGRKLGVQRIVQWHFAGAKPSPQLAALLLRFGINIVE